jgi:hypothetical protein
MKILLLTQVLPYPPDSGPKVKTWNVIKYLATRHELTLVSFVRGDQSAEEAYLRNYCHAVHTVPIERTIVQDGMAAVQSLASGQPWMMVRDRRAAMRALVRRLAATESFDVVHADQLNMAQYALQVPGARHILDAHNALWVLYGRLATQMRWGPQRLMLERDWRLLRRYEGRVVMDMDGVLAVSDEDRGALLSAARHLRDVTVIPIAVDTDELTPVERLPEADHLLHIGTMYGRPTSTASTGSWTRSCPKLCGSGRAPCSTSWGRARRRPCWPAPKRIITSPFRATSRTHCPICAPPECSWCPCGRGAACASRF